MCIICLSDKKYVLLIKYYHIFTLYYLKIPIHHMIMVDFFSNRLVYIYNQMYV